MGNSLIAAVLSAIFIAGPVYSTETETYDLIFKTGTLSEFSQDTKITYDRDTVAPWRDATMQNQTGDLILSLEAENTAVLSYHEGEKSRFVGRFPTNVGNPAIMYFMEATIRDVAEAAGGSPFYIRNRFKESLLKFAEVEDILVPYKGENITVQQITLRPFLKDQNGTKMGAFAELKMKIAMSPDVPGWYYSLIAEVSGGSPSAPLYESKIVVSGVSK